QTSHEHLHLLGSRVLGLVENHKRVIESASAHECDGRDLDDVFLQIAVYFLRVEHVVERVIQRPQVWIDFFLQRAGKKSEPFTRFNRRPSKDDAVHALRQQSGNRHRNGEIGFAGAGGADAEDHVVRFNGVEIATLIRALRLHHAAALHPLLSSLSQAAQRQFGIGNYDAEHAVEITIIEGVARTLQLVVVRKDLLSTSDVVGAAFEINTVGAQINRDV